MASRTYSQPLPPASTTPAFSSTGFWCTVSASARPAEVTAASRTASTSSDSIAAASAAETRETVRMVPSVGFMTALYAASTPPFSAAANSAPSQISQPLRVLEKPRNRSDKITPELPRAPRSMAEAILSAVLVSVSSPALRSSSAAAFRVMLILVPVSPSGTGKTFSSLICCLWFSTEAAALRIILRRPAPSMVVLTLGYTPLSRS